jgi:hypothetical protein
VNLVSYLAGRRHTKLKISYQLPHHQLQKRWEPRKRREKPMGSYQEEAGSDDAGKLSRNNLNTINYASSNVYFLKMKSYELPDTLLVPE